MILSVRLREGRDDDLAGWVQGIPLGDRSHEVRRALRTHLSRPRGPATPEIDLEGDVFSERDRTPPTDEEIEQKLAGLVGDF